MLKIHKKSVGMSDGTEGEAENREKFAKKSESDRKRTAGTV